AAIFWQEGRRRPAELIKAVGSGLVVVAIIILPFVGALDGVWAAYARAAKYYPFTHFNGFSAWFLGNPLNSPQLEGALSKAYVHDDTPAFLGITSRTWGFFGLVILWGRVFIELIRRDSDQSTIRWAARVLPLGFFLISTQMHERYLFPAIALWAWAALPTRRWWMCWIGLSLCAAANQFWVWPGPRRDQSAQVLASWLHHEWVGISASIALILIFALSLLKRPQGRPVSAR
ncbi:MAG TPA: hypothetical protein VMV81_14130, partial [Phycisphaerae bacterium]|nr:hypothetical protein [Phycisphaerae bacterium]